MSCALYLLTINLLLLTSSVMPLKVHLMQSWPDFEVNCTLLLLQLTGGTTIWDDVCMLFTGMLNCQCNLKHLTAILYSTLKDEFVIRCIFGVFIFTR